MLYLLFKRSKIRSNPAASSINQSPNWMVMSGPLVRSFLQKPGLFPSAARFLFDHGFLREGFPCGEEVVVIPGVVGNQVAASVTLIGEGEVVIDNILKSMGKKSKNYIIKPCLHIERARWILVLKL